MDTTTVDKPIPLAPAGLSFPSGLPAAALNFPASSSTSVPTQLAPVPAAPGPASPERSTRSSAAAQQQKTAQQQGQDDSPAERRQSKEERDQLRQVKAERRARRGDYQNTDKQEKLMTSLMEMLGEFSLFSSSSFGSSGSAQIQVAGVPLSAKGQEGTGVRRHSVYY